MTVVNKKVLVLALAGVLLTNSNSSLVAWWSKSDKTEKKHKVKREKKLKKEKYKAKEMGPFTRIGALDSPTRGLKEPFTFKKGDAELTIGGKIKIEHKLQDNMYLLNKNIPDQNEYFKETVDLTFDVAYGQEKYGYKAIEMFADLRHKGIWGKALSYADRDAGPLGPSFVKFGNNTEAIFGAHDHTSGKPLIWFKDAWLQFSLNAAVGYTCEKNRLHFVKLGWFPFDLGRGIAMGGYYGLNKELLGLYSYVEDKAAPGINLHGDIIKDRLSYDLYYAKFEERNKNLSDTINLEKRHIVGRSGSPWRGVNKDDEVIAARLKWVALKDDPAVGTIELEPYIFYNAASDQTAEIKPDMKSNWGSYGFAFEHTHNGFEWGSEVAFNYGKEKLFNIDRNKAIVANVDGHLVEQYTKLLDIVKDPAGKTGALVTPVSRRASQHGVFTNSLDIPGKARDASVTPALPEIPANTYRNATGRFRLAFENKFDGWMAVVDGAYNFKNWNLKLAAAYGYASGDVAPHKDPHNKTYHGFVGLHELYNGKRVKSIMLLDERLLKRPVMTVNTGANGTKLEASPDMSFTDLQHVGLSATWTPKTFIKDLMLNPNIVGFWKVHQNNSYDATIVNADGTHGAFSLTEKASNFMGTEINLLSTCTVIKDLTLFANLAAFIPGGFFTDMIGVPLDDKIFQEIVQDDRNPIEDAAQFRLHNDVAYHINVGLEFKF